MTEILVVEDEARTAREIAAALVDEGVRPPHAATSIKALKNAGR